MYFFIVQMIECSGFIFQIVFVEYLFLIFIAGWHQIAMKFESHKLGFWLLSLSWGYLVDAQLSCSIFEDFINSTYFSY